MHEITRVILTGGPEPLTADEGEACGVRYERDLRETVDQFRDRASAQAEALGCISIIFGPNEDDGE